MSIRRRSSDAEEDELDPFSQPQLKRARIDDSDDELDGAISSADEADIDDSNHVAAPLAADEDGYVQGSIVKIKLRNFVTYDYCEFSPGPQLNMIIGPNGTGKSTIVCAIALGLGGSPSLLGRAKNIAEFVKTGEDEAMIQIELKRTGGRPNVVIQRTIQKTNNQSSWRLDGRPSPLNRVMAVIAELNIQVDNLCQFLPQDKVAEFAQLTPTSLLTKTQEAAGEKELLEWHNQLIEWRSQERDLQKSFDSDQDHLKSLRDRNQYLERDVLKIQQREEIMKRIQLLEAKLPLAKYSDSRHAYEEAKESERDAQQRVQELESELEPIRNVIEELKQAREEAAQSRSALETKATKLSVQLKKTSDAIQQSNTNTKSIREKIKGVEEQRVKREKRMEALEERIQRANANCDPKPPSIDFSEIDQTIENIDRQQADLEVELNSVQGDQNDLRTKRTQNAEAIRRTQNDYKEAQDIVKRRLALVGRHHEYTERVSTWLSTNRKRFKGKIHGPIVMNLNIKDQRYANLVEAILGGVRGTHLRTFVCEYQEDYHLFTKEILDKKGWRVTVVWPNYKDEDIRPVMSQETLREKYGLEYFIHELLEGPKFVIDYLCAQAKIHMVPVSLRPVDENRIAQSSPFRRFCVGDNIYEVKKYSFGHGGQQTAVRGVRRSELFSDNLDGEQVRQLKTKFEELRGLEEHLDEKIKDLEQSKIKIRQKMEELRYARNEKKSEKRDMQVKCMQWEQKRTKIEEMEGEIEAMRNEPEDSEEMIRQYEQAIADEVDKRAKLSADYTNILKNYVKRVVERNISELAVIQTAGKHKAAEDYSNNQMVVLKQAEQAYRQVVHSCRMAKNKMQSLREAAERAGRGLPAELAEEFRHVRNQWRENGMLDESAIQIEDTIQAEKARADTLRTTNPRALEQYEARKREIDNLSAKVEEDQQRLESLKDRIQNTKNQWEPRLTSVVSKISVRFSEALQRIGCAGEVCVHQEEDFDRWGIEIRVKFRDNEKLQLLTGQRQSGGERAVSTILYLMALQNLARAPFRVVDEINQGMDPRNERMIHEQIVKGASKPGTAQYFLITPKLLPDLYYNERMRVLCIYNGEWQPKRLKPLTEYLRRARAAA